MMQEPLVFESEAAKDKPENIRNRKNPCPFCDVDGLTDIIRQDGDKIWLVNKFRTLRDTMQTVLIESADHTGDPSTYDRSEWRDIMRFAVACFEEMRASGAYCSVLMFKSYGVLSGGTLLHPHFQIVGLDRADGYAHIAPEHFEGVEVYAGNGIDVTVSTRPVMGFVELNVRMGEQCESVDAFADAVQALVRYLLAEHHGGRCESYNLFFYRLGGRFMCKAVPRWVASPYYIGYRLAQVNCESYLENVRAALAPELETWVGGAEEQPCRRG